MKLYLKKSKARTKKENLVFLREKFTDVIKKERFEELQAIVRNAGLEEDERAKNYKNFNFMNKEFDFLSMVNKSKDIVKSSAQVQMNLLSQLASSQVSKNSQRKM